jgi:protein SCO1
VTWVVIVVFASFALTEPVFAHELSPRELQTVRFEQHLDAPIPLDLAFRDETGQTVRLADYFGPRPVLLTLNYFHCQNLCPLELEGLVNGLNGVAFTPGRDFTLLSVDIDPREGPADTTTARARALRGYDRPAGAVAWHMLTGDQSSIDELTRTVGFEYLYDPQEDEFAHPAGVVVLTPSGRVSRYLYGIDFSATDLRLALVDAAAGAIGTPIDKALLVCYHYDPLTGRYTALAVDLLHWGGGASVVGLGALLAWLWRAERKTS